MSLPSLVGLDEFAVRVPGGLTLADEARAQAVLDDVSALVRAEGGTDWVDDDGELEDVPEECRVVCLQAALRYWSNPTGRVSETIGSYTYRVGDSIAQQGGIYLLEHEKRIVRQASGVTDAAVTMVELNPERATTIVFADVEGSDRPIPIAGGEW